MPKTPKGTLGEDPTRLIALALKQLALDSERPDSVYLTDNSHERAIFFSEMTKEFGKDFPELKTIHYISDSSFWSEDLSHCFSILFTSNAYVQVQNRPFMRIQMYHGTREQVEKELNRDLGEKSYLRQRFLEFVANFEALVRNPPGLS